MFIKGKKWLIAPNTAENEQSVTAEGVNADVWQMRDKQWKQHTSGESRRKDFRQKAHLRKNYSRNTLDPITCTNSSWFYVYNSMNTPDPVQNAIA